MESACASHADCEGCTTSEALCSWVVHMEKQSMCMKNPRRTPFNVEYVVPPGGYCYPSTTTPPPPLPTVEEDDGVGYGLFFSMIVLAFCVGFLVFWCCQRALAWWRLRPPPLNDGVADDLIPMEPVIPNRWEEHRQQQLEDEVRRMAELLERPVDNNLREAVADIVVERARDNPAEVRIPIPGNILLMEADQMELERQPLQEPEEVPAAEPQVRARARPGRVGRRELKNLVQSNPELNLPIQTRSMRKK